MESVLGNIGRDFASMLDVNKKKKSTYEIVIDGSACIKCGQCADACLTGALEMNSDNINYNTEKCTHCGLCKEACPINAIKINK